MKFYWKEISLVFSTTIVTLILCVSFLEKYYSKKMLGFASPTQFDSIIGWVNYPKISRSHEGHTAYGSSNKKMNRFTINSQGYRSEEVDHNKKHILILGDSVAYGSHVDDHETLPHYLNSYYKNYQVINLGVPGYGIGQAYLLLKRHIKKLNPKMIVFVIYTGNDFFNTRKDTYYRLKKPLFGYNSNAIPKNKPFPQKPVSIDIKNLSLINNPLSFFPCGIIYHLSLIPKSSSFFNQLRERTCKTKQTSSLTNEYVILSLLRGMELLAKKEGSKIFFIISPSKTDFDADGKKAIKEWALMELKEKKATFAAYKHMKNKRKMLNFFQQMLRGNSLPHHDHFKFLKSRNLDTNKIYIDDHHYSSTGNQLLAQTIYNLLDLNDT